MAIPFTTSFTHDGSRLLIVDQSDHQLSVKIIAKDVSSIANAVIPLPPEPPQTTIAHIPPKSVCGRARQKDPPHPTGDSFSYFYRGAKSRGEKYWRRIDQGHWEETNTDGKATLFEVLDTRPGRAGLHPRPPDSRPYAGTPDTAIHWRRTQVSPGRHNMASVGPNTHYNENRADHCGISFRTSRLIRVIDVIRSFQTRSRAVHEGEGKAFLGSCRLWTDPAVPILGCGKKSTNC